MKIPFRYPKIREFRLLFDFKQEFVADQLGISQPEYSRLENGFRRARMEDFKCLADIYQVNVSTLMFREDDLAYTQNNPKSKSKGPAIPNSSLSDEQLTLLLEQHSQILDMLQKNQVESQHIIHQLLPVKK